MQSPWRGHPHSSVAVRTQPCMRHQLFLPAISALLIKINRTFFNFTHSNTSFGRCRWLCSVRCGSKAAWLLKSRVRIPLMVWMLVFRVFLCVLCIAASAMSWSLLQRSPIECVCVRACMRSRNLNNEAAESKLGLVGHRRRKRIKFFVCHGKQITQWRSYIWNSRISVQRLCTTIRFVPSKIAFV